MELGHHISAIQGDLAAAAALGGEQTAEAGRRLSEALASSLQLRLLDVLTEAGLELNSGLPDGHVEVRLAGRDPELVYVAETSAADEPGPVGEEMGARITLRLPEALKAAVEAASGREGVSTNTWIVRALRRGLDPRPRSRTGNRIQGFARS
jgi:hypothetical protein